MSADRFNGEFDIRIGRIWTGQPEGRPSVGYQSKVRNVRISTLSTERTYQTDFYRVAVDFGSEPLADIEDPLRVSAHLAP